MDCANFCVARQGAVWLEAQLAGGENRPSGGVTE